MTLKPKQEKSQKQQPTISPQVIQESRILEMSDLELQDNIEEELLSNPMLEELPAEEGNGESRLEKKTDEVESESLSEVNIDGGLKDEWESYTANNDTGWIEKRDQTPLFENISSTITENLWFNLMLQLVLSKMNVVQREIGAYIIGNLNEDGYLMMSIDEICQDIGKYQRETVEETLRLIQKFDPIGVAARDLKECLLIQARSRGFKDSLFETIIKAHLENVANKKCDQIAKSLSVPLSDVHSAVSVIRKLDPRPGQRYSNKISGYNLAAFHIKPEIVVHKDGDDYRVAHDINYKRVGISTYYHNKLTSDEGLMLADDERQDFKDKLESAKFLIKSLYERQKTVCRVTESVIRFQRESFDTGSITCLKPLISREVGEDIQIDERKVRRASTNKYIDAPHGVFKLKFFFDKIGIDTMDGGKVSSKSVKEIVKNIIKSENREKPYSDREITELLKSDFNINVNLRVVTKYRKAMDILPSRLRKWPC